MLLFILQRIFTDIGSVTTDTFIKVWTEKPYPPCFIETPSPVCVVAYLMRDNLFQTFFTKSGVEPLSSLSPQCLFMRGDRVFQAFDIAFMFLD